MSKDTETKEKMVKAKNKLGQIQNLHVGGGKQIKLKLGVAEYPEDAVKMFPSVFEIVEDEEAGVENETPDVKQSNTTDPKNKILDDKNKKGPAGEKEEPVVPQKTEDASPEIFDAPADPKPEAKTEKKGKPGPKPGAKAKEKEEKEEKAK